MIDTQPTSLTLIINPHSSYMHRTAVVIQQNDNPLLLGSRTVVRPYVGMARKQNGGYNAIISRYFTWW